MDNYFTSTDAKFNDKLNVSEHLSCEEEGVGGGRVWNGAIISKNKDGLTVDSIKCGGLKTIKDIYTAEKDTVLDNLCNCEMVDTNGPTVTCPSGKYIRTHYPLLDKALCCAPCTAGQTIIGSAHTECSMVTKDPNKSVISCPTGTFMNELVVTQTSAKAKCCAAVPSGSYGDKQQKLEEKCIKLRIPQTDCTQMNVDLAEKYCGIYGIEKCDIQSLNDVERQCQGYGMRYFDTKTNKYQNPTASMECHTDNFGKMEERCTREGVRECTVTVLDEKDEDTHMRVVDVLGDVNGIQGIYETKFKRVDDHVKLMQGTAMEVGIPPEFIFMTISGCVLILILTLLIFMKRNN